MQQSGIGEPFGVPGRETSLVLGKERVLEIGRIGDNQVITGCRTGGNNIEKAQLAQAHFRNALHLFPPTPSGWEPQVLTYSGYYGIGIDEVWKMIDDYVAFVKENGYFDRRRREQSRYWLTETIDEQLRAHFYQNPAIASQLAEKERRVLVGEESPFTAAQEILDNYFAR